MQEEKQAVLFIRVRHLGGADADTEAQIAAQRQAGHETAQRLHARIVHEYVEYGGTDRLERRPVVRQLLAELGQNHDAAYVITDAYDRLARRVSDLQAIEAGISAAGASLVTPEAITSAPFNPTTHAALRAHRHTMAVLYGHARKEARRGTNRQTRLAR